MTDTTLIWTILFIIVTILFVWWVLRCAKCWENMQGEHQEETRDGIGSRSHGVATGTDSSETHGGLVGDDTEGEEPIVERDPDDLTQISGIGKVIAPKLNSLGVTTFDDIAKFTATDIAKIDEVLNFKGRIERERWVEQAQEIVRKRGG